MTTTAVFLFRLRRIRRRLMRTVDPYEIHRLQRQAFRYATRACELRRDDPRIADRMTLILNGVIAIAVKRRQSDIWFRSKQDGSITRHPRRRHHQLLKRRKPARRPRFLPADEWRSRFATMKSVAKVKRRQPATL
jgi:hypothetical protein